MKRVLAFAGSPRRGGNSESLLNSVLAGVRDAGGKVEKLILNEMRIIPCQGCGGCDESGLCIVQDDMQLIYPKLDSADVVIVASPIFFSGISAQTKAFIDRCQCHWVRKFILKQSPHKQQRAGAFLSVRGQAGLEVFQMAAKPVRAVFATEDVAYSRELFVDKVDAKGDINKFGSVLEDACQLGMDLVLQK